MSSDSGFEQLLDATLQHLEGLKAEGHRFVDLDAAVLRDLMAGPSGSGSVGSQATAAAPVGVAAAVQPRRSVEPAATLAVSASRPPVSAPSAPKAAVLSVPAGTPPTVAGGSGETGEISGRLSPEAKEAAFEELRKRVLVCTQCAHLASSRKSVVFGVGTIYADLMFVGEAPGADEDVQGEPFVGPAGQLLDKIIQTMGLSRQKVYIANVLKCRPDTPGQSYGNRKPTPDEMKTCLPYLYEQIRLIRPKVMVALGGTAMEGLFGRAPMAITKLRGTWMEFEGIPLMPTFHPSYLLRTQETLATRRQTWEDMLQVMERLGMPVSEKQRGYFMSKG